MSLKSFHRWFELSFVSPFVSALALLLISALYSFDDSARNIFSKVVAIFFWVGVVSEIVFLIFSCKKRKQAQKHKMIIPPTKKYRIADIGMLSFFQNKAALIADAVFFVFLILVVLLVFINSPNPYLVIFSVSALFLSFNLHCILNGKNYRYYKQTKVRVKK